MNRLKNLRKNRKVEEIASLINVSVLEYKLYEDDKKAIPSQILCTLANYYDTSIDYILMYTDEKKPYRN